MNSTRLRSVNLEYQLKCWVHIKDCVKIFIYCWVHKVYSDNRVKFIPHRLSFIPVCRLKLTVTTGMKTIKTPAQRHCCRFGALIINFKHIPPLFVVLLLLSNLSMQLFAENCRSKRILILFLTDSVIIHISHIIYI